MPSRARLVRKAPLIERAKAYLDPVDFLLWLSEELNDDVYDEWLNAWATAIGIAANVLFVLARGASKVGHHPHENDDVFGDFQGRRGTGWLSWLAAFLVHVLTALSCLNAFYTFFRMRHYRLFEQPIDVAPSTPSAQRVRVDSSPLSSSPLRYLQHVVSTATASSRAYPDAEKEVWEVNLWDPKPFSLSIFTTFSPGHVLMYCFLLPPSVMDPRPSVTVVTAFSFAALLSLQLTFLKRSFSQQAKDSALVHGEVMNEYDTKYVRPALNRPVRDVGIQAGGAARTPQGKRVREVDTYTPTTIINRGFMVNPNPNYANQYDPDGAGLQMTKTGTRANATPALGQTHDAYASSFAQTPGDLSSPIKSHQDRLRERSPAKGDGGSLGVYNHAASPLRKVASYNQIRPQRGSVADADGSNARAGSPLKRVSMPGPGDGTSSGRRGDGFDVKRRRETGRH